jgi:hypothetical protein
MNDATPDSEVKPHANEVPPAALKAEIPKLDTSLALWLILFVFGGGLLALYYAGIGYFPEVSWQDSLTYMALMTIIGGSLLVAYSFLLFVPGAIWSEFLIFDKQLHKVLMMGARAWEPCVLSVMKRILFPFALFMAFCHLLLFLQDGAGRAGPVFVALGAAASLAAVSGLLGRDLREALELAATMKAHGEPPPAGAVLDTSTISRYRWFVGALHALLFAAFIAKVSGWFQPGLGILWISALLPLASFVVMFYRWLKSRGQQRASESAATHPSAPLNGSASRQGRVPDKWSLLCRSIVAFDGAALLSLVALWFFHRIYSGKAPGAHGPHEILLSLLLLCTVVVIVANLAVSVLFHKYPQKALLASFMAALLLLGAGQLLGAKPEERLPAKIMEKFGFGGQSATLVLTDQGGRLLCQQAIPVEFEERTQADVGKDETSGDSEKTAADEPGAKGRFAHVAGMTILSRLGSQYILRYEEDKRTIALPKEEVLSWSLPPEGSQELKIKDGCKQRQSSQQQDAPSPAGPVGSGAAGTVTAQ